jgi:4-alpha-glucanotransferase
MNNVLDKRRAGILLHITSLPSTLGLGSMGKHAYRFVDFLKECDLSVWQVLPIHPLHRVPIATPYRDFLSPYQPMSAFAGNPMLINLRKLVNKGWLPPRTTFPDYSSGQVEQAFKYRHDCLKESYFYFMKHANSIDKQDFDDFVEQQSSWLKDYALFCALKDFYSGACWWNWGNIKHRNAEPEALAQFCQRKDKKYCLERYYFEQFAFFTQWSELKQYANDNGVYLFGDLPFFVARDSVEVWAHREYFQLDETSMPLFFSGIPPEMDYFYPDKGQCWGHPLYHWDGLQSDDFAWWVKRFETINRLFDLVRLTYFQGFHQCWAIHKSSSQLRPIPARGEWQITPPQLFNQLLHENSPIMIADDVGGSEVVSNLRDRQKIYSIKILQLAFDLRQSNPLKNQHLPHHYSPMDVVYTGTHDSDTTMSWLKRISSDTKKLDQIIDYINPLLDKNLPDRMLKDTVWSLTQLAFRSVAKLAIIPMQDILFLGKEHRMNSPKKSNFRLHNWRWQFNWAQPKRETERKLKQWMAQYERN